MAPKKTQQKGTKSKREKVVAKKSNKGTVVFALAGVAAVAIVVLALVGGGAGGKKEATPEEKRYLGRYLPAGYQEPKLTENISYTSTVKMTQINATTNEQGLSLAVGDVIQNRIVYFEWQKPGSQPISMIAYMKPSGKLFVGMSYCPPCQGKYQRIEADGTLTCETCGTKRDLEKEIGYTGPCKLYPLDEMPVKVVGDKITVDKADLDKYTPQPLDRPIGQ
ncbi:MAG: Fe-S-containing protein [Actinobacteria bacterium]|nr:Fe-S-containing protein [Actinomycetota bacterium]